MDNPVYGHGGGDDGGRQGNTAAYHRDPHALNGDTVNATAGDVVVRRKSPRRGNLSIDLPSDQSLAEKKREFPVGPDLLVLFLLVVLHWIILCAFCWFSIKHIAVDDAECAQFGPNRKPPCNRLAGDAYLRSLIERTKRKLYVLQWISEYSSRDFVGDVLAGLTIGLTVIPQSMALAGMAGLPAQYGLYSSFAGAFVYVAFGTSKVVPMGPSAIVALMTYNTIGGRGPACATLLCFTTGVVQALMSLAGLGAVVNFISVPVCSGFTSASAILVIASQVKDLIGVRGGGGGGGNILNTCRALVAHAADIGAGDTAMGLGCIAAVMLLKTLGGTWIGPDDERLQTTCQRYANKLIWAIGAFRNSFVVIMCALISYCYVRGTDHDTESDRQPPIPFKIIGKIPQGLPSFGLPEFGDGDKDGFVDLMLFMGSGVLVLPLISLLENISLCRTFADGKPVDTNQELLAIGLANVGNSLFHGFAGTGAIARGALNYSSGVRTPLGGLYTGLSVVAALLFLTPYFYYIPKTSLAAVIIAASFMMVDIKMVSYIYRSKKRDLVLMLITFFSCLFLPLEYGVLIGIVANIGFILCSAANPKISIQMEKNRDGIKYLSLTPDRYLIFPSMEYVRQTITEHGLALGIPVVIDGSKIFEVDYTTANVFSMMSQDFLKKGQFMYLYNLKPSVLNVFRGTNHENIFLCSNKNELDDQLKKHFGSLSTEEHSSPNEMTLTSHV